MADNPKSLASLADELERKADALGIISRSEEYRLDADLYRRAAAALRAPSTHKSLASLADEATERYYKSVSEYRSSEYSANAGYDFRAGWEAAAALRAPTIAADELLEVTTVAGYTTYRRLSCKRCDEAALATPIPTIAAPSPSKGGGE